MKLFDNYKFTDRKHPAVGIMSVVLGFIGIISETVAIFIPYLGKKEPERYAFIMALSFLYAIAGIVLGLLAGEDQVVQLFQHGMHLEQIGLHHVVAHTHKFSPL